MTTHYPRIRFRLGPSLLGGVGVFAAADLPGGDVVAPAKFYEQTSTFLSWSEVEVLDSTTKSFIWDFSQGSVDGCWAPRDPNTLSVPWFINHSCDPNVGFDDDDAFILLRSVAEGDELVWDYATGELNPRFRLTCVCGTATCRELITGDDWRDAAWARRARSYSFSAVRHAIDRLHGFG